MTEIQKGFSRRRRGFLGTLGGLGMSSMTMSISAATKSGGTQDTFKLIDMDMCISPTTTRELHLDPTMLPKDLTFTGSRLMKLGFLDTVAEHYGRHTGSRVRIIGGGCDDGLIASRQGKSHFGELCCPVPGSPAAGMRWLPVAKDIKVVLTSPDNPVQSISLANLRKVMSGEIRNWRELGGIDRPIVLIVHNHCPRYLEPVRTKVLDSGKSWSKYAMRSNTDFDHLRQLARFPFSLGISSWILAKPYVKQGQLKALNVDGATPSVASVLQGNYPLTGPLNLIFALWMDDLMRPFLDFLYSEESQSVIAKNAAPVSGVQAAALGNAPEYVLAAGKSTFKNRG